MTKHSLDWFTNRVGMKITCVSVGDFTIRNKEQAAWLHLSQKHGYEYSDIEPVIPNVCIACEG